MRNMPSNYEPRPDCATIGIDPAAGPDVTRWWILLSAEATVLELALLNHGLPCNLRVEHDGDGVFRLHPVDPDTPPPTDQQIRDILTGAHAHIPTLWARQA